MSALSELDECILSSVGIQYKVYGILSFTQNRIQFC